MKRRIFKVIYWFFGIIISLMLLLSLTIYIYKDDIIKMVVAQVNPYLNTEVDVKEIDLTFWATFPKVSVDFNQVFIKDATEKATKSDTLLQTERIRLKFNPLDIWNENYHVENIEISPGTFQMKVDSIGQVNYKILKEVKDTTSTPFNLKLEQVFIEGVRFSYDNQETKQSYYTKVKQLHLVGDFASSAYNLKSEASLFIYVAKSGEVSLIRNKNLQLNTLIEINTDKNTFDLKNTDLKVENIPIKTEGHVYPNDVFFTLKTENLALTDFIHHFAMKEIDDVKKINGQGKINFDLIIKDNLKENTNTQINCRFQVLNGSLIEPSSGLKISDIEVNGAYQKLNGANSDELAFKKFKFRTRTGPFNGHLKVTQFISPLYQGFAKGSIDLSALHALFKMSSIEKLDGNIQVYTNFKVKTFPKAQSQKMQQQFEIKKLDGQVEMSQVNFKLAEDKRTFSNINGLMYLKENEAGINDVSLKLDQSDIKINGVFQNLQAYINNRGSLNANVELSSNRIRIEDLSTTSKEEKIQSDRKFVLPNDIIGQVFVNLNELTYAGHRFENIEGNLFVGNRMVNFPSIHLRNANADIKGALRIEERSPEIFTLQMMAESDNIQFKPLFKEWDNFKQEAINMDNISGKATVKMSMEAPFDLRTGIQMNDILSQVYMKIENGRLSNVKAFNSILQSIKESSAKLILGKRNVQLLEEKLKDLKFETLENTFYIKNSELQIPKMEIKSSLMDINLEGKHQFNNDIDYRFSFRFRDLKSQDSNAEFGEEIDDGTGLIVFMRMYGNLNNPKIIWDKQAKKEQAKENREKEKADVKAIFKSEFGLFKNDTTVKQYQQNNTPKEELKIEFGPGKEENPLDIKKPKKNSKLKDRLDKLKKQSEEDKKESIEFEN